MCVSPASNKHVVFCSAAKCARHQWSSAGKSSRFFNTFALSVDLGRRWKVEATDVKRKHLLACGSLIVLAKPPTFTYIYIYECVCLRV